MKIAIATNVFPTLSETFIMHHIIAVMRKGHEVKIVSLHKPKAFIAHEEVEQFKLMEKVFYMPRIPDQRWQRVCEALSVVLTHAWRNPRVVFNCLNLRKYKTYECINLLINAEFFIKNKFDIIHCHFGPVANELLFLKDILKDVKLVTTFHGYDVSSYLNWHNENVYDALFEKGDLFLPISKYWKEGLTRLGCPESKIRVHHMGVDTARFQNGFSKPSEKNKITLLTVGRLVEKKGHEWVMRALKEVAGKYRNFTYVVAGDGPLRGKLESLAKELSLEQHVQFLGAVTQSQVLALYKQADIFILASVTAEGGDKEGIPVGLMEAMAMEIPVISTLHSGIPELIVDGETGFLVPERNVEQLAVKIELLLANSELRRQVAKRGREVVKQRFNETALNEELNDLYTRVAGNL